MCLGEEGDGLFSIAPDGGQYAEALGGEVRDAGVESASLVVPIAEDDVARDKVDGGGGVVVAAFEWTVVHHDAIDQAITPHQHFKAALLNEVRVEAVDFDGEEFGAIHSGAARAVGTADVHDLIHPDMNRGRLAGIDDLIDER